MLSLFFFGLSETLYEPGMMKIVIPLYNLLRWKKQMGGGVCSAGFSATFLTPENKILLDPDRRVSNVPSISAQPLNVVCERFILTGDDPQNYNAFRTE